MVPFPDAIVRGVPVFTASDVATTSHCGASVPIGSLLPQPDEYVGDGPWPLRHRRSPGVTNLFAKSPRFAMRRSPQVGTARVRLQASSLRKLAIARRSGMPEMLSDLALQKPRDLSEPVAIGLHSESLLISLRVADIQMIDGSGERHIEQPGVLQHIPAAILIAFFVLGMGIYRFYYEVFEKRGSDAGVRAAAEVLRARAIDVDVGRHDLARIARAVAVVASPGVPPTAPPLVTASRAGIPIVRTVARIGLPVAA